MKISFQFIAEQKNVKEIGNKELVQDLKSCKEN